MLKKIGFIGLITLFLWSCGNEKVIQLPEVQHAKITEILDVSPAYIFYNETQPDSIELNRKNLIISTNWLFNVDKRLTLEQAIPKIKFLQDKKRNAKMHKNEAAKNYYTCNDTSIKNLGFIDFTDVNYVEEINSENNYIITINSLNDIAIHHNDVKLSEVDIDNLIIQLEKNFNKNEENTVLTLHLNKQLKFQDYITVKNRLQNLNFETIVIDNNEYIF
ncbi:hypothetical protein FHS04_001309 [Mesoflavibacter sabulilitoris]|uniref:Uncharacterized protein n=1 Tax=Mesoflavibacter zeaxanthinifaciens subsp. sabulilitoris TaxID=1520893 RepID=A0A2T1NAB1_9FLAO|nr:hypothetical protein [Mesoflavibacter zeaxanthinifaciens]MBB3123806.1 hypothetical protein [Mesoflavibacter zeaxanthinifaciens subsp. sabulilitoris]PSG89076.1 hypothetical protein C7H61_08950 [Mesoflavibacter zeaxanthinifaciens subsp. sabulilitoris]